MQRNPVIRSLLVNWGNYLNMKFVRVNLRWMLQKPDGQRKNVHDKLVPCYGASSLCSLLAPLRAVTTTETRDNSGLAKWNLSLQPHRVIACHSLKSPWGGIEIHSTADDFLFLHHSGTGIREGNHRHRRRETDRKLSFSLSRCLKN